MGGCTWEFPVRSSGEFVTKVRVSVLAGSQESLPDVGNAQSDNLRVIARVGTVREGPRFAYCLHAPKKLDLSGLKARTRSRDDVWSIMSRRVSQQGSLANHQNDVFEDCPLFYFICQYQLTTIAFISSKDHPESDVPPSAGWSGPSGVNNKQASYRYKELTTVDIAAEHTVWNKFQHNLNVLRVLVCPFWCTVSFVTP